ncbi:DNA-3-methyladenine glycosylase family protein [Chloroflexota bacterium]
MSTNQTNLTDIVGKLKKQDSLLAIVIDQIGPCPLKRGTQGLTALVHTIVGQQLSRSSAQAIRLRLDALLGNNGIDPKLLAETCDEDLRKTGLSLMKISYLRGLTDQVLTGRINFHRFESMDDEAIIETLSQVKGIGRWTAEMYLIFSLNRLDVFPIGDLAIRTAMTHIYHLSKSDFDTQARNVADRWRPFRTIACWYLYRYLDNLKISKVN